MMSVYTIMTSLLRLDRPLALKMGHPQRDIYADKTLAYTGA
jgi:hypothetical protein